MASTIHAPSFATPLTPHLSRPPFSDDAVYAPAEDTFVLLDALEADHERLQSATVLVEVGSGSGCVSAFLSKVCGVDRALVLSTDLSQLACRSTDLTSKANGCMLNPLQADLVSPLRDRLRLAVDVLVFNPPYVPTEEREMSMAQTNRDIAGAWAGGEDGMSVTNRLLDLLPDLLSPGGSFYLVAVPENRPLEIVKRLASPPHSLIGQVILKRRAGREILHVLRFSRMP